MLSGACLGVHSLVSGDSFTLKIRVLEWITFPAVAYDASPTVHPKQPTLQLLAKCMFENKSAVRYKLRLMAMVRSFQFNRTLTFFHLCNTVNVS